MYYRARYMQPESGRFTSSDPIDPPVGLPVLQNQYIYVADNPVNLTDPTGQLPIAAALVGLGLIYVFLSGLFWQFVRESVVGGGDELTFVFATYALMYGILGLLLLTAGTSLIFDFFGDPRLAYFALMVIRNPASTFFFAVIIPCIGAATLVTWAILLHGKDILPTARAIAIGIAATVACVLTFGLPIL
jgi:hypothetical protein